MRMKIKGLNNLKKLQKGLNDLANTRKIPIVELLNDSFLEENTNFKNFNEFENSNIFDKYKTIEEIPDQEMDEFIKASSKFNTWDEMLGSATEEYIAKKLRF